MNVWVLLLVLVVGFGCTESSSDGSSSCEVTGSCSAMGDAMLPMTESTDVGDMSGESEVLGSDTTLADEDGESASDDAGDRMKRIQMLIQTQQRWMTIRT